MKAYGDIEVNLLSIWKPHGYLWLDSRVVPLRLFDTEIPHIRPICHKGGELLVIWVRYLS
jgi:hypothetical protein